MTGSKEGSWGKALEISKKIGIVPISFQQAMRILVQDHFKNKGQLKPSTKYQIARLLRGPNFKAMLYYVTKEVHPEYVSGNKSISIGGMIAKYNPLDLAAIIGAFIMSCKINKLVGDEAWALTSKALSHQSMIGTQVGVAIPNLGIAPGLLVSCVRPLALQMMMKESPGAYDSYTSTLKESKKLWDIKKETEIWECSSAETGAMLLTAMGFGSETSEAFMSGLTGQLPIADIANPLQQQFRLAVTWFECFVEGREQPKERLAAKFFPRPEDREKALKMIGIAKTGAKSWIERRGKDVSPELTPQLFAAADNGNSEFEIPDQMKDVFTLEELTSMEEEDFDTLLDQIDSGEAESEKSAMGSAKQLQELEELTN